MIRINLLPVKQKAARQYGKQQLIVGLLLLVLEAAVLYALYKSKVEELDAKKSEAARLQTDVETLQKQSEEIQKLEEQKDKLKSLADILGDLEANRAGPVQVLDELKEMLNMPANDLQRVAQDRKEWNTSWDPTHLWLTSFKEDGGDVTIDGKALSNDDVAEFTIRLGNSKHFSNVRLERTALTQETGIGAVYTFNISADVNYGVAEEEDEEAEGEGEGG